MATALIRPLAWEPPYAVGVALKKKQKTNKNYLVNLGGRDAVILILQMGKQIKVNS